MEQKGGIINRLDQLISLADLGSVALQQAQCSDFMNLNANDLKLEIESLNLTIGQTLDLLQTLSSLGMDIQDSIPVANK